MALHKGIRLRIETPHGDIVNMTSLLMHYTSKYGAYADQKEWHELLRLTAGHPECTILIQPIEEWEEESESESDDCNS